MNKLIAIATLFLVMGLLEKVESSTSTTTSTLTSNSSETNSTNTPDSSNSTNSDMTSKPNNMTTIEMTSKQDTTAATTNKPSARNGFEILKPSTVMVLVLGSFLALLA